MAIPLTPIKLYLREYQHEKINALYEQMPEALKQKTQPVSKLLSHLWRVTQERILSADELTHDKNHSLD